MGRSVMAVSRPSGLSGERRGGSNAKNRERKESSLFAEILSMATQEIREYHY